MRFFRSVLIGVVASLTMVSLAQAAQFETGQSPFVSSPVSQNLYIAGSNVSVSAPVKGDVVAAGGTVTISEPISGGAIIAGGTITLNSNVSQNVRVGGGTVMINGLIGNDLLIGGGQVQIAKGATISGDLIVGGGSVTVDGTVKGMTRIGGGMVTINGTLQQDAIVRSGTLNFGASAVAQTVRYTGQKEAQIALGAKVKSVEFTQEPTRHQFLWMSGTGVAILLLAMLYKALSMLLLGFVLIALWRTWFSKAIEKVSHTPWAMMGWGFVGLIVTPVAAIIAAMTLVGVPLAFLGMVVYMLSLTIGQIIGALYLGTLILHPRERIQEQLGAYALGTLLLMVALLIPVLGWLAQFAFLLIGLGGVLTSITASIRRS